jgi:miniconductance mechanosensitive channel
MARDVRGHIKELFGDAVNKAFLPFIEIAFWILALLVFDFILQKIFGWIFRLTAKHSRINWIKKFYAHKVFRTIFHFITINILISVNPYVFQKYDGIDKFADKFIGLVVIIVIIRLVFRFVDAIIDINDEKGSHTTVGVRAFGQMIKIFAAFFGALIFIATLIDTEVSQIFTILGALTAVVLLIFRDSILGFVSGLQIASSKSIKVGDWISVSKYDVQGIVKEINLAVTKIENFDKSLSTVPTYDLIASEVTNNSWMTETNTRRIKRPIMFNVNSFSFCDEEMLNRFSKIDLIKPYIEGKKEEIRESNQNVLNKDFVINGRQLTNIGVYRKYAEIYLTNRADISKSDKIVIRQLEQEPQGMPLEIYCFATTSDFVQFEKIQSDIFDHLLSAAKIFDLEISQPFIIQQNHD